jgi:hypothetical protein
VADDDSEFTYPRENLIVSSRGFSIEVRAPAAIRYAEAGRVVEIFAEVLATAEPRIAIRSRDIAVWQEPDSRYEVTEPDRRGIVENIRRAFAFKEWGLVVE